MAKRNESRKRLLLCLNASLEKKAKDLVVLNVKNISSFTDYFIICSGTSDRQVRAIAAAVQENLKKEGIVPLGVEGEGPGRWILLDYEDVVINIFLESVRPYYDLENLWSDAPKLTIPDETASIRILPKEMEY